MKLKSSQSYIGLGVMLLGAVVMLGWLFRQPVMVRFPQGTVALVFNTGLSFFLGGLGVLVCQSEQRRSSHAQLVLGSLIIILNLLVLIESLTGFSLGIDGRSLHEWLIDGNPLPGRQAPNTNLAFLCFGVSLIFLTRAKSPLASRLVQALAFVLTADAVAGLIGYGLRLESLYGWSHYTNMAFGTAMGLALLAVALWILQYKDGWLPAHLNRKEDARVALISGAIMALIASCAGLGGFAILEGRFEQSFAENLQRSLQDRARLFSTQVDTKLKVLDTVASLPNVAKMLEALSRAPPDGRREELELLAKSLQPFGYSGVIFSDLTGQELGRIGQIVDTPNSQITLRAPYQVTLLWDNQSLFLNARTLMSADGASVGQVLTQQPLPIVANSLFDARGMGDTAELIVCARLHDALLRCLPTRRDAMPSDSPVHNSRGDLFPVARAINDESGFATSIDRNDRNALVAYGPIGTLGLGMVLTVGTADLFQPIREQLKYLLPLLTLLVIAGALLVRAQVRPLAAQLMQSERQARRNEARLRAVTDNVPALIAFMDSQQRFRFVNKAHQEWFGEKLADIQGKTLKEVFGDAAYGLRRPQIETVLRGEQISAERHHVINGRDVYLDIVYIPEFDESHQVIGYFVLGHDITERKQKEVRLETLALRDALTGLANRRLLDERLAQAIAHARRNKSTMAVLFLDLDGLKQVNDTLGHEAGDLLLKAVAERLVATVREEDTVARLGGDEFVIALWTISCADDAGIVAEKIIASVSRPLEIKQQRVNVTTSIGIGVFPNHGKDSESLLKAADLALYEAKRAGKDTYRFS